jgi:putative restriction endonuclease
MPFHALGTDGVWALFDREGRPSRARDTSVAARIDAALREVLVDPEFRAHARRRLIGRYFPAVEQVALNVALGFEGEAAQVVAEDPGEYLRARETGRSARFKNLVVGGYRFTCALTGYRLVTSRQAGIVEAAHIHALRDSRNNDPRNGLALTPTAHVLFDLGLWSVDDELRILVQSAAAFEETAGCGFSLRALAGRPLHLVPGGSLRPGREHLAWHRRHHGFAGR